LIALPSTVHLQYQQCMDNWYWFAPRQENSTYLHQRTLSQRFKQYYDSAESCGCTGAVQACL